MHPMCGKAALWLFLWVSCFSTRSFILLPESYRIFTGTRRRDVTRSPSGSRMPDSSSAQCRSSEMAEVILLLALLSISLALLLLLVVVVAVSDAQDAGQLLGAGRGGGYRPPPKAGLWPPPRQALPHHSTHICVYIYIYTYT